jgi:uncharacterized protein YukE
MTARRQAILKDYDNEINALYDVVEGTSQVEFPATFRVDFVAIVRLRAANCP